MKLSNHFSLEELCSSQTAARKGIDNTPGAAVIENLTKLAAALEKVRALVGQPIAVSSGYRSPALNAAIGGARNSAHCYGLAADIFAPGMPPLILARAIKSSKIQYDQLIYEGTWVHIGLSSGQQRRQNLTATFSNGSVSYQEGIA
ncbi:D-Ala-D-Ala carboxypeptidase family metallohydrolase [Massilia sp. W12]|uniref:D-Ala-D-Ala carboxypeptidase family metallohydrolase n=1 Tax=Massilia sp. W12 TaxID=3126507 RepID=UPI0030D37D54